MSGTFEESPFYVIRLSVGSPLNLYHKYESEGEQYNKRVCGE